MELRETKSIIMALGLLLVLALVPMAFADENQTGTLDVSSTPSGANIYLNSVLMGQTPLSLTNVSEGNHTLNLTKEGYNDYVAIVGVTVNQTTTVNATLTALPLPITTGTLAVSSVPSGANIYLNNALKGQSPLTILNLSAGNYTLNLTKSGYNDYASEHRFFVCESSSGALRSVSLGLRCLGYFLLHRSLGNRPLAIFAVISGCPFSNSGSLAFSGVVPNRY